MKMDIILRFIISVAFISFVFFLLTTSIYAHPGNTDIYGCHTCRTNCTYWGLYYGQYHCHTPKYLSCPLFSTFDSVSGLCKCMAGYYMSNGQCQSYDQACKDQLGASSWYNSLSDKCECMVGNIIDPVFNKCTSAIVYCSLHYGLNANWNFLTKKCECKQGFAFGKSEKCITMDDLCQEQIGENSYYDIEVDNCHCSEDYYIENGTCTKPVVQNFDIKDQHDIINTPASNRDQTIPSVSPITEAYSGAEVKPEGLLLAISLIGGGYLYLRKNSK